MSQTVATSVRKLGEIEVPAAGTWVIDPSHTAVTFIARHLMVTKVRGRFERFSGEITVGERPEHSSVAVSIEAASITTNDDRRDTHLRSPDFLDVERFPTLSYRSSVVRQTGPTKLQVDGELTIRDVTRPVTLDVEFQGVSGTPWGSTVAGFTARAEINREDFGMTWNQALETGGVLVGKKVTIEIDVEATASA